MQGEYQVLSTEDYKKAGLVLEPVIEEIEESSETCSSIN